MYTSINIVSRCITFWHFLKIDALCCLPLSWNGKVIKNPFIRQTYPLSLAKKTSFLSMYVCMVNKKPSQAEGFWTYIHTCIEIRWKCKTHHRERGFESALQKPLTGRGVLKRTLNENSCLQQAVLEAFLAPRSKVAPGGLQEAVFKHFWSQAQK